MEFAKWQALGNDYIVIEDDELPWPLTSARVRTICAMHFGCHSDGILLLSRTVRGDSVARLRIFNPDGSEAELSGNGAREAALYMYRSGWTSERVFGIETKAGVVVPTVTSPTTCSIDMGRARLRSDDCVGERRTITADGTSLEFVHVNIGNPHAVIDVGPGLADLDLGAVGPSVERAPIFPRRTNVEFIHVVDEHTVRARIWERGVGETTASGTGASASAVAASLGAAKSPITVILDGGSLDIEIDGDLRVRMTGPAEPVFSGVFSPEFLKRVEDSG